MEHIWTTQKRNTNKSKRYDKVTHFKYFEMYRRWKNQIYY